MLNSLYQIIYKSSALSYLYTNVWFDDIVDPPLLIFCAWHCIDIQQFLSDKEKKKTHQNVPQKAEAMIQLVQSQAFRNAPINFVGVINECITALLLPCSLQLGFFFFTNKDVVFNRVY